MCARHPLRYLVVASLCTTLSACGPNSVHPLTDPKQSVVDANLIGVWALKDKDKETSILVIGKTTENERPAGFMQLAEVSLSSDGRMRRPLNPEFFVSRLKKSTYMNILVHTLSGKRDDEKESGDGDFCFVKYRVEGDRLEIFFADKKIIEDIEGGKIGGKVERDKFNNVRSALLTDESERLRQYLESGGEQRIFPEASRVVFERIRR